MDLKSTEKTDFRKSLVIVVLKPYGNFFMSLKQTIPQNGAHVVYGAKLFNCRSFHVQQTNERISKINIQSTHKILSHSNFEHQILVEALVMALQSRIQKKLHFRIIEKLIVIYCSKIHV